MASQPITKQLWIVPSEAKISVTKIELEFDGYTPTFVIDFWICDRVLPVGIRFVFFTASRPPSLRVGFPHEAFAETSLLGHGILGHRLLQYQPSSRRLQGASSLP